MTIKRRNKREFIRLTNKIKLFYDGLVDRFEKDLFTIEPECYETKYKEIFNFYNLQWIQYCDWFSTYVKKGHPMNTKLFYQNYKPIEKE